MVSRASSARPSGSARFSASTVTEPSTRTRKIRPTWKPPLTMIEPSDAAARWVRLYWPRGQYNRTHLAAASDGSIIVSGGFHVGRIFRVRVDGSVTVLAENLADPEGLALDARDTVYVAESSLHRIVRLRPLE